MAGCCSSSCAPAAAADHGLVERVLVDLKSRIARRPERRVGAKMQGLSQSFIAEPHAVPAARHSLGALDGLVDDGTRETLRLLVSELVSNAVVHGSRRPTDSIALRVSIAGGTVRVQVRDRGLGLAQMPRQRAGDVSAEGWGLFLVDQLADRWGVLSTPGNELWFELDAAAAA